jgi:hypothetical protein
VSAGVKFAAGHPKKKKNSGSRRSSIINLEISERIVGREYIKTKEIKGAGNNPHTPMAMYDDLQKVEWVANLYFSLDEAFGFNLGINNNQSTQNVSSSSILLLNFTVHGVM